MPPLSIPARTFRLIPAKQAIPPPPPYHASVRNAIHRNEINQITTQIQQSCSTNVFNVSASSSSTLTTNINAINASSSSSVYVNRNSAKRLDKSNGDDDNTTTTTTMAAAINNNNNTTETSEQHSTNAVELVTANDFSHENPEDETEPIARDDEGDIDDDDDADDGGDSEVINHNETPSGRTNKTNEHPKQRPKQHKDNSDLAPVIANKEMRNFKEETVESTAMDVENLNDKKTRGLKVLSNVQVSPNAILNVSLNTTNAETIPLNNMIIVSSIPSTSTATTSQVIPTQLVRSQSLLKSLNESRLVSDAKNPKHTKVNVEVSINWRFLFL